LDLRKKTIAQMPTKTVEGLGFVFLGKKQDGMHAVGHLLWPRAGIIGQSTASSPPEHAWLTNFADLDHKRGPVPVYEGQIFTPSHISVVLRRNGTYYTIPVPALKATSIPNDVEGTWSCSWAWMVSPEHSVVAGLQRLVRLEAKYKDGGNFYAHAEALALHPTPLPDATKAALGQQLDACFNFPAVSYNVLTLGERAKACDVLNRKAVDIRLGTRVRYVDARKDGSLKSLQKMKPYVIPCGDGSAGSGAAATAAAASPLVKFLEAQAEAQPEVVEARQAEARAVATCEAVDAELATLEAAAARGSFQARLAGAVQILVLNAAVTGRRRYAGALDAVSRAPKAPEDVIAAPRARFSGLGGRKDR
jgi:hypothetical protein